MADQVTDRQQTTPQHAIEPAESADAGLHALDQFPSPALRHLARLGVLRNAMREQILTDLAASNPLPEELSDQLLARFEQEAGLDEPNRREAFLSQNMLSERDLRGRAERGPSIQQLIQRDFTAKAEARFLQRKDHLDRVVYSLLRLQDRDLARELHLQVTEGEIDFAQLAEQYSDGPEKQTRGIVGPVPLAQAHPQLALQLRRSRPGELLEPFAIENWWLIVRLESISEASFNDAIALQMATELFESWLAEEVNARLNLLHL